MEVESSLGTVCEGSNRNCIGGNERGVETFRETGSEEFGGGSWSVGRRSVGKDEEFTGNVLEEDKSEWFNSMATKGGGEEEKMTRIVGGKVEFTGKIREKIDVILQVRSEE